jgi:hypothetical protein
MPRNGMSSCPYTRLQSKADCVHVLSHPRLRESWREPGVLLCPLLV